MWHALTGCEFEVCAWLHEQLSYWCDTHWQTGSLRPAPGYMNYWCDTDRPEVWGLCLVTWTIDVTHTDRPEVWGLCLVTWIIDVTRMTSRKFEVCAWLHELLMLHWQAGSLRSAPGYMSYGGYTDRPEVWGLRLVTWTIDLTLTGRKFDVCCWLHELLILHTLTGRRFEACCWLHELLAWHTLTSRIFEHWARLHGLRIKTSCYTNRLVQDLVTWTVVKKVNKKSTTRKPFCAGRWFAPGNVNCG